MKTQSYIQLGILISMFFNFAYAANNALVSFDKTVAGAFQENDYVSCICTAKSKFSNSTVYQISIAGSTIEKITKRCQPNESQASNNVTNIYIEKCEGL